MYEYFDIHSHFHFPDYDTDREEIIAEMKKLGIGTITIGTGLETSKQAITLAEKNENIFASIGLHPDDLKDLPRQDLGELDEEFSGLAKHPKVVAIGECGLDYFSWTPGVHESEIDEIKKVQKKVFEEQIELSLKVGKPLMLHIRSSKGSQDAYNDGLEILESYAKKYGDKLRGNAHFFAGHLEILKRFLALGFTVSFTGVLTFTHDYDELVRYAPLNMIMSETDAPYVAPVPHRGKRNSPLFVPEIVSAIASIRSADSVLVKKTLVENAMRNFKI
jgi:TatD DNase family protein